jgi:PAS domain S-box-containing protein
MEAEVMSRKPPYSEVKQRGKNLEREAVVRKQAEDALRESEERYRNLVESVRDVIYTLSEEGTVTSLNPAFESITGWSRKELIGQPLQSIVHPDDWPAELEFLELMLRGETPPTHQARVRTSSGEYLVVESRVTPRFQGGKFVGVLGVARDITERRRVEDALRESEEKYRDLVENMSEVIYAADNKGMIVYISPAIESFMGYSPSEIIGRPYTEFIYEEDLPRIEKRFYEVLSGNLELSEYRVLNKFGDIRWILVSSKPTVMKNGGSGVRGVLTDVTERKRAEESLRESEARYRELADSIADVFFAIDKELRYTYWNQASENLTGISAKDAIGKSLLEIFPDTPQARKAEKVYSDVLRTQRSQSFVTDYQLGGKDYSFEISTYPSSHGVSVFVKDITERRRAEEQLEIKTNSLEEANTALKVLLKRRDEDRRELEEKVLFNMKELALPYLEKLKASGLDERRMAYLSILESNLEEIISPFSYRLSSRYLNLTPAEIQVANLIKQGKTSKEIAEFLNISSRTISFHRANIREKIEIKNKKANLRAHLLSLH